MIADENLRWTEIQFAYLCDQIYKTFLYYPHLIKYIEFLADVAGIETTAATKALSAVTGMNRIHPTNFEYIYLARKNGYTVEKTIKALGISKSLYMDIAKKIKNQEILIFAKNNKTDILVMQKLLDAHNKIKEIKV